MKAIYEISCETYLSFAFFSGELVFYLYLKKHFTLVLSDPFIKFFYLSGTIVNFMFKVFKDKGNLFLSLTLLKTLTWSLLSIFFQISSIA